MYDRTLEGNGGPKEAMRSIKNTHQGIFRVQKVAIKKETTKEKKKKPRRNDT